MAKLYFLKMNIQSRIYDIYEDTKKLEDELNNIYETLSTTDYKMEYKYTYYDEKKKDEAESKEEFKVNILHSDSIKKEIVGDFRRYTTVFLNEENKDGELVAVPNNHIEAIRFYFDIKSEIICFYVGESFRHRQFQKYFQQYLNEILQNKLNSISKDHIEDPMQEHVILEFVKLGSGIELFYKNLLEFGKVRELYFDVIAPNASEEVIKEIKEALGEKYEDYKEAGVTKSSMKYVSNIEKGLNVKKGLIKNQIKQLEKLNKDIIIKSYDEDDEKEEIVELEYVKMKAINSKGETLESDKSRLYTQEIEEDEKNQNDFINLCRNLVGRLKLSFLK